MKSVHWDGQTVKTKLIVTLRKFANASKNAAISVVYECSKLERTEVISVIRGTRNCLFSHFAPLSDQIFQQ
jgi:hypothetical protein